MSELGCSDNALMSLRLGIGRNLESREVSLLISIRWYGPKTEGWASSPWKLSRRSSDSVWSV